MTSAEDGFSMRSSSRASQQIATVAEPTTGSSVTRKGVKYTPKLDSIVMSRYTQNDEIDASDSSMGQSSKVNEVSPVRQSRPSRSSRPKSDINTLGTRPKSDINTLGTRPKSDSNTLGMSVKQLTI